MMKEAAHGADRPTMPHSQDPSQPVSSNLVPDRSDYQEMPTSNATTSSSSQRRQQRTNNSIKTSRKRRLRSSNGPLFVAHVPSIFLKSNESPGSRYHWGNAQQQAHHNGGSSSTIIPHDGPDLAHYSQQLAALLLCTVLGLVSALDAKQQCLEHETYMLLDLVDDDNFQKMYDTANISTTKCVHMFRYCVVPVGVVTILCSAVSLILIWRHHGVGAGVSGGVSGVSESLTTTLEHSALWANFQLCTRLLTLVLLTLIAQTYNIVAVMLQPRGGGNNSSSSSNGSDNPYQSLAAVDVHGHVGKNANLYYLAWVSQGLALALTYQLLTVTVRLYHSSRRNSSSSTGTGGRHQPPLLPTMYWASPFDSETRSAWYHITAKLRIRTGFWTAAILSASVISASSQYVWNAVLWPTAVAASGDGDATIKRASLQVCRALADAAEQTDLPPQLCIRTAVAWMSGLVAAALCAVAIGIHLYARQGASKVLHEPNDLEICTYSVVEEVYTYNKWALCCELVLSMILSVLLGFNAVFATGVQGPAATVGNLYYASWLGFLLCLRICLGCLEEYHEIEDKSETAATPSRQQAQAQTQSSSAYKAPEYNGGTAMVQQVPGLPPQQLMTRETSETMTDPLEKERAKRLRSYFFLGVFSIVCAASAYDAASNQNDALTTTQKYMMISPCVVAVQSTVLFLLCLWKRFYRIASHFYCGGLLSFLSFGLWLGDLVLTMHSEDSWAVNSIGEIEMANLYYFSWAAILTAGLQMMSYVKAFLRIKKPDYMSVVWVAICKVCFVILGAAAHIWHTIADNCDFDEITSGAVTFCSRTVLAMIVALTGMLVGGLVVTARVLVVLCPTCKCTRLQAHVEMLISVFLVFLFGAAVALITGIGGPGQSVGDLYYSTWLAFFVSIGIFVSCYDQIRREDAEIENQKTLEEEGKKIPDGVLT